MRTSSPIRPAAWLAVVPVLIVALGLLPGALAEGDAEWSAFTAPLHELDMPEPGFMAVTLADGERYLATVIDTFGCGITRRPTEDFPVERFTAQAVWTSADGRAWFVDIDRTVSGIEMTWRSFGAGHESDRVWLHVRDNGDERAVTFRDATGTATGDFWLVRASPGDEDVQARRGEGELPAVRVDEGGQRATVIGVIEGREDSDDDVAPYSGPIAIAVHCPA